MTSSARAIGHSRVSRRVRCITEGYASWLHDATRRAEKRKRLGKNSQLCVVAGVRTPLILASFRRKPESIFPENGLAAKMDPDFRRGDAKIECLHDSPNDRARDSCPASFAFPYEAELPPRAADQPSGSSRKDLTAANWPGAK